MGVVGKLGVAPAQHFVDRFQAARMLRLGMTQLAVAQIDHPRIRPDDELHAAAFSAQAAHLEQIDDLKKIRPGESGGGAFDRLEEAFAVDRLGKNLGVRDLEPLRVDRVGGEEKSVQAGKPFA